MEDFDLKLKQRNIWDKEEEGEGEPSVKAVKTDN